ncbi:MAG: ATP-NAD kinase, partial [Gammaproteobacteria bacterium]
MLKVGLVINPYAGIGGPVALKGSDGAAVREQALALGSLPRAGERTLRALAACREAPLQWFGCAGAMGEQVFSGAGLPMQVVYQPQQEPTEAVDTRRAAMALCDAGV